MSRAVLLLHGFATDIDDFAPLLKSLNTIYDEIDLKLIPGHGQNDHLKNFKVKETFLFVNREFEYLKNNYDEVDIIGFSMGGALATYLASKYDVTNLVLLAPANEYLNPQLVFSRARYLFEYLYSRFNPQLDDITKNRIERGQNQLHEDDKKSFDITMKKLIPNYNIRSISTFSKIVKHCNDNLKQIEARTLIIWGDCDQLVPLSSIEFVVEHCKNVTVKMMPRISHLMLNSSEASKLVKEIIKFLKVRI